MRLYEIAKHAGRYAIAITSLAVASTLSSYLAGMHSLPKSNQVLRDEVKELKHSVETKLRSFPIHQNQETLDSVLE